eukprot:TRINITY_DN8978_c0_g1_i1.p1 TRINITY_DN8978_c0_g1~~TRINITY_DN8978_c0_g1_i1.p1  ORF type:complete len:498 (+),score=167.64 TRINITY_DN8978_c0_g1_i1:313-1806(+)
MAAVLALARVMSHSEETAETARHKGFLEIFVRLLNGSGSYEKKVGAFALRSVAKHSADLAQAVIDAKGVEGLSACLANDDSSVKEMAVSTLAQLAKYKAEQAQLLNQRGVTQQLIDFVSKQYEESLKRESLVTLTEIAKHSESLGDSILEKGACTALARLVSSPSIHIRRQACACLAQIARHGSTAATRISEEALEKLVEALGDSDKFVKRNAMTCVREIIKHEEEEANKLNKFGGPAPLIRYINETTGNMKLPGIVALCHYAAADQNNAKAVIDCNGIQPLKEALLNDPLIFVQSAAAWGLGIIAGFSEEHAAAVVEADVHEALRTVVKRIEAERRRDFAGGGVSGQQMEGSVTRKEEEKTADAMAREDLRKKVFEALARVMEKCNKHDTMIDIFLEEVDDIKNESTQELLKVILQRLGTLVREKGNCWKKFAMSGALKKLQDLRTSEDTEVKHIINTFFQGEVETIALQYKDEFLKLFRKKEDVLKKINSEPNNS